MTGVSLLVVLNLAGTFVFGLSGALAGVRARLDVVGVVVVGAAVGLAGGAVRDVLIGIPAQSFRDARYLVVVGGAGALTCLAHPVLGRLERSILFLDAAGLALFCVTGATTAVDHGVSPVPAAVLGAITAVGGGMVRDLFVGEVPIVLRQGLYAIPAVLGASIVVAAREAGAHGAAFPVLAAAVCFAIRVVGVQLELDAPRPSGRTAGA